MVVKVVATFLEVERSLEKVICGMIEVGSGKAAGRRGRERIGVDSV